MKRPQIIALGIGIIAVVLLFSLPRVVVDNEEGQSEITAEAQNEPMPAEELHDAPISDSDRGRINSLSILLETEDNKEKFATLADSIASLYSESGKFDSAAYFFEKAAEKMPDTDRWEKAGTAYYEAYSFALNEQKVNFLAEKTRVFLNRVLEKDPSRLDLKTKVAMTYVSTSNPMQGITMLREILEADPKNEDAIFNMGVLSMQSGQYKRAVERFEELVSYHPTNLQGQFYLAVSYFESKQNNKAKKQFQQVRDMTSDPMVLASVDSYLERL